MGYNTDFEGDIEITPALTKEQKEKLDKFLADEHEEKRAPSYYCELQTDENGECLFWTGAENTYGINAKHGWFEVLIKRFFKPWGCKLTGTMRWRGEDFYDIGTIRIKDNEVKIDNHGFPD